MEGLSCDGVLVVTRVTARLVYLMAALAVASAYLASWAPTPLPTSSFLSQYLVFTPLHSPLPLAPVPLRCPQPPSYSPL